MQKRKSTYCNMHLNFQHRWFKCQKKKKWWPNPMPMAHSLVGICVCRTFSSLARVSLFWGSLNFLLLSRRKECFLSLRYENDIDKYILENEKRNNCIPTSTYLNESNLNRHLLSIFDIWGTFWDVLRINFIPMN